MASSKTGITVKNRAFKFALSLFCCNENHYFSVRLGGENVRFCTRSVPMLFGGVSTMALIFRAGLADRPGWPIAGIGILLILPDILYWGLTRKKVLPDHLEVRVATGFLLGAGLMVFGQADIGLIAKILIPFSLMGLMVIADRVIQSVD